VLPEFTVDALTKIEKEIDATSSLEDLLPKLRWMGLDDFGLLMLSMPNPNFPKMSAILPRMASEQVQKSWTGSSGVGLLRQTLDFVRSTTYNFARLTGSTLEGKRVLDFGCGYGRIARLMYYFTHPQDFYGVDPWDKSIEICRQDGLTRNFFVSDYLPTSLPTGDISFSLIYAFSVFTHLSERATRTALAATLKTLDQNGLLAITIRPVEYWKFDKRAQEENLVDRQIASHRSAGFSFLPHNRASVDGDITYGDTSMSLEWLQDALPGARIAGFDRSLNDPYQIYVFIRTA
jgi:SAM-dependent methyltransferase